MELRKNCSKSKIASIGLDTDRKYGVVISKDESNGKCYNKLLKCLLLGLLPFVAYFAGFFSVFYFTKKGMEGACDSCKAIDESPIEVIKA